MCEDVCLFSLWSLICTGLSGGYVWSEEVTCVELWFFWFRKAKNSNWQCLCTIAIFVVVVAAIVILVVVVVVVVVVIVIAVVIVIVIAVVVVVVTVVVVVIINVIAVLPSWILAAFKIGDKCSRSLSWRETRVRDCFWTKGTEWFYPCTEGLLQSGTKEDTPSSFST